MSSVAVPRPPLPELGPHLSSAGVFLVLGALSLGRRLRTDAGSPGIRWMNAPHTSTLSAIGSRFRPTSRGCEALGRCAHLALAPVHVFEHCSAFPELVLGRLAFRDLGREAADRIISALLVLHRGTTVSPDGHTAIVMAGAGAPQDVVAPVAEFDRLCNIESPTFKQAWPVKWG